MTLPAKRKSAKTYKTRKQISITGKTKRKMARGSALSGPEPCRTILKKLVTGIRGLDEVLDGGLPLGRSVVISGGAGSGKTVFCSEFIYRGIVQYDQPGVFVTFEERPQDIIINTRSFGWDFQKFVDNGQLAFVDLSPSDENEIPVGEVDFEPILARIKHAVNKVKAQRVVIDSLSAIFNRVPEAAKIRSILFRLMQALKKAGVTVIITHEKKERDFRTWQEDVEFVSDGLFEIQLKSGQNKMIRIFNPRKLRGTNFRSGEIEFEINDQGIEVFSKINLSEMVANSNFEVRKKTGIPALDEALDGGIPQGHMMLIAGNTGTGKTTFGMNFLVQGVAEGESGVWVAFEETPEQITKTALTHDWDFQQLEQEGKLVIIRSSFLDISPNQILRNMVNAVKAINAKRVVIDSVSTLESSVMSKNQVKEFLIQAIIFFKSVGVTCYMSYLTAQSFGASEGQLLGGLETNDLRLSSIVDGVIMMRYVERDQSVKKLLNILKLRGSQHSKDIFQYENLKGGIEIGQRFGV